MKKLSLFYIILAGALWGTSGVFFTLLKTYSELSPVQLSAIRNIVAGVAICVFFFLTSRKVFKTKLREVAIFAASGLFLFLTSTFYYCSMATASLSVAVILMYTAPVMVMVASVFLFGEKLTLLKAIAVLAVLAGCGLVTGIMGNARFSAVGIITGLLAGVSYASYNICTKWAMRRGNNPVTAAVYCFMFSAFFSIVTANPFALVGAVAQNPAPMIPLSLGVGVITSTLPYLFYTMGMKNLPAGTATALGSVEPMTATLLSVMVFHEVLTLPSLIGIFMILASVIILSLSKE
ncbi:MAG: EamA family transporter [Clostridia bacterium]|nr:EamA family transporter [Clostridia bacterium]